MGLQFIYYIRTCGWVLFQSPLGPRLNPAPVHVSALTAFMSSILLVVGALLVFQSLDAPFLLKPSLTFWFEVIIFLISISAICHSSGSQITHYLVS